MPNHCDHDLYVTGPKEEMKRFFEYIKNSFEEDQGNENYINLAVKAIPYPPEREIIENKIKEWAIENNVKYEDILNHKIWGCPIRDWYNSGGYDWCIKNWGTKWGIYSLKLEADYNDDKYEEWDFSLTFETAWTPGKRIFNAIAKLFPLLHFNLSYFESGTMQSGNFVWKDGVLITEDYVKYYGKRGG
jgi:hypothetical protein